MPDIRLTPDIRLAPGRRFGPGRELGPGRRLGSGRSGRSPRPGRALDGGLRSAGTGDITVDSRRPWLSGGAGGADGSGVRSRAAAVPGRVARRASSGARGSSRPAGPGLAAAGWSGCDRWVPATGRNAAAAAGPARQNAGAPREPGASPEHADQRPGPARLPAAARPPAAARAPWPAQQPAPPQESAAAHRPGSCRVRAAGPGCGSSQAPAAAQEPVPFGPAGQVRDRGRWLLGYPGSFGS